MQAYASIDAEKISDWFVNYLSLMVKRDEAQKSVSQNQEEIGALEKTLNRLGSALRNSEIDWQRRAREAAEAERVATEKNLQTGEKITGLKARPGCRSRRKVTVNRRATTSGAPLERNVSIWSAGT